MHKTDTDIKSDVMEEIRSDPTLKAILVDVHVEGGTVTLYGHASNYGEKSDVVRATKRVSGVQWIDDKLEIQLIDTQSRTDVDIAVEATKLLDNSMMFPAASVTLTVHDGWITLAGDVDWWYQRNAAENYVRYQLGVKGVSNTITVKPKVEAVDIERTIKLAFVRNALLEARKIHVVASGGTVTIKGLVNNFAERDEAERIVWSGPTVSAVDNQLKVDRQATW
jgi:osmotically-inducible protein OsmY